MQRSRSRGTRSYTAKRQKKEKKKPLCELGSQCPYIHEYQHNLEFSHEGTGTCESAISFQAFSGRGHTIATSPSASHHRNTSLPALQTAAGLAAIRRATLNPSLAEDSTTRPITYDLTSPVATTSQPFNVRDENCAERRSRKVRNKDKEIKDSMQKRRTEKKKIPQNQGYSKRIKHSSMENEVIDLCD